MSADAALLKETTDTLRGLLNRGKETQDDGIRMILGPRGWREAIDLIGRADAALSADPFNGELFHAKNLLADIERNSGAFNHFMDIDRRVMATALRLALQPSP